MIKTNIVLCDYELIVCMNCGNLKKYGIVFLNMKIHSHYYNNRYYVKTKKYLFCQMKKVSMKTVCYENGLNDYYTFRY